MVRRDQKTVQENRKAGTVILTVGANDTKRLHPRTIGDTPPSKKQNGVLEDPYSPGDGATVYGMRGRTSRSPARATTQGRRTTPRPTT